MQQRQQQNDAEQRHRETRGVAGNRNNYLADKAVGAIGPFVRSLFKRPNDAEHEPEKGNDPARVENGSKSPHAENARRPANESSGDRHQGKRAAAHAEKKRERFAKRGCRELNW